MNLPFAESYKIKMVEPVYRSTRNEREEWIRQAKYNLFNIRSEQVFIDLPPAEARKWMNPNESQK